MKLKELLLTTEWKDIEESLVKNYADASKCIDCHEKVFSSLPSLTPAPTELRICIKEVFDKDFDDEPHTEVFGKDGTLNKELSDFKYMNEKPDSDYANSEVEYAIEFVDWEEWLNMEIDKYTVQKYSNPDIVAHCLWEMTFFGYDKNSIQEQKDELDRRVKELENMSEEERKEKLIPWEKVKEEIENRIAKRNK